MPTHQPTLRKLLSVSVVAASILLLVSGCAVQPVRSQVAPTTLPVWVTQPPKDDSATLWGVGEGPDLESAKRSALKDVAAKLRVSISAQLESRTTVSNQSVDRYARTRVSEDVQRTEFRNHALEKSVSSSQGFYALVRVDRQAFVADAVQKLAAAEKEISTLLSNIETAPPVERFVAQQKALPWLEKAVVSSQILVTVDTSFDCNRLQKHESTLHKAKNSANELVFEIKAGSDSQDVSQAVRGFLNDTGVRIGKGGAPLIIESSSTQDVIFGSKTVKLQVGLNVLDAKGRTLTTREFISNGSSVNDFRAARQAAIKNFGEKLRTEGPVTALGFSQN